MIWAAENCFAVERNKENEKKITITYLIINIVETLISLIRIWKLLNLCSIFLKNKIVTKAKTNTNNII